MPLYFVLAHRHDDIRSLALRLSGDENAEFILRQVEGWQKLRHKVPLWAKCDNLLYPRRISLEQCSGEEAARYKANLARRLLPKGNSMADLTGGFGVDFAFLAPHFRIASYVEQSDELCRLAQHNFPILGITADVICSDAEDYLKHIEQVDLIMLDPARRDNAGRKTVLLPDCQPDVTRLLPTLIQKATFTMVKLSPMLDLHHALTTLNAIGNCVSEIHVFASSGECRELLFILQKNASNPFIYCTEGDSTFAFKQEDENTLATIAKEPMSYIYEPSVALLKAGAFNSAGTRFGLHKLHINSHLYTSNNLIDGFMGRRFRLLSINGFSKKELKQLMGQQANLAVRNFPSDTASLRARLKLNDGGSQYWFATTLADGRKVILRCEKV